MYFEYKERILFEISEIDKLIMTYELLLTHVQHKKPDNIELAALATVLHSFYPMTNRH